MKIKIEDKILSENDRIAAENRGLLKQNKIYGINIISSPGSGKTSLIEALLKRMPKHLRAYVLIGDVQTENDAERIRKAGFQAKQIITGGGCHLNAKMIATKLKEIDLSNLNLLIIENVGNLVCPSAYDLGEDDKIVILSLPEGEDKPVKYPAIFSKASLMLLHKMDLLNYINFDKEKAKRYALSVNPKLTIIETSCVNGDGIEEFKNWVICKIKPK